MGLIPKFLPWVYECSWSTKSRSWPSLELGRRDITLKCNHLFRICFILKLKWISVVQNVNTFISGTPFLFMVHVFLFCNVFETALPSTHSRHLLAAASVVHRWSLTLSFFFLTLFLDSTDCFGWLLPNLLLVCLNPLLNAVGLQLQPLLIDNAYPMWRITPHEWKIIFHLFFFLSFSCSVWQAGLFAAVGHKIVSIYIFFKNYSLSGQVANTRVRCVMQLLLIMTL